VDCHVPLGANNVADHSMVGGNVYMASEITNDPTMTANVTTKLQSAISLTAAVTGVSVDVTVRNRGSGHAFPTGVTDIREPWVELQAVDGSGNAVAHYGGPAEDGTIPLGAPGRLGVDLAAPDGTVLYFHELSKSSHFSFSRLVPPLGTVDVTLTAPATLPAGAVELDAVLYYRNVRTPFFRGATGNVTATAPQVEVARVKVE
jgi:hypothetical protein